MKKVTIQLNNTTNEEGSKKVGQALNDLSGVVAADVATVEQKAYVYAGDRLNGSTMIQAVQNAGYSGTIINEEYENI